MAAKKTGISPDLLIHPGETIADVLEDRGITQVELATRTGVSPAYISAIISGKKNISTNFARSLEYALGIPKSFWLNLQANYDAERLEVTESQTITENEKLAYKSLSEVINFLRKRQLIPVGQKVEDTILSLRKILQISNLENLTALVPQGAFRMAPTRPVNAYVLGAWLRLCQIFGEEKEISTCFDREQIDRLVAEIKAVMMNPGGNLQQELSGVMNRYGIDFSVVQNFKGAPVQGYITQKMDGIYKIVLTIRVSFADIFWFSLFHEIGHIMNGDVSKGAKFIDSSDSQNQQQEELANLFASNALLSQDSYEEFIAKGDFSIEAIFRYANSQGVQPYIVIGRLQREERIPYSRYSRYKLRYKWEQY